MKLGEVNLSVPFCGYLFKNPLNTASGCFGNGQEYGDIVHIFGGMTSKAVTPYEREGNEAPRTFETEGGVLLNAIGLQNAGVDAFIRDDLPFLQKLRGDTHVIVNVSGRSIEEYVEVATKLAGKVPFFEVNISCPNVQAEGMIFGQDTKQAERITRSVVDVAGSTKVIVKMTPNVTSISDIAKAIQAGGADAISLINTLHGAAINVETKTFELANKTGGCSGPAIKPVAVRCILQARAAVDLPIIGMGGVMNYKDVIEMMLAGACIVSLGTVLFTDVDKVAPIRILNEIRQYCVRHDYKNITDLIGIVRL